MFRKTLTANDKSPVRDCENLSTPTQMQLSLKPKTIYDYFLQYLEDTSNFKHFEKKDDRLSYFMSEITDTERLG